MRLPEKRLAPGGLNTRRSNSNRNRQRANTWGQGKSLRLEEVHLEKAATLLALLINRSAGHKDSNHHYLISQLAAHGSHVGGLNWFETRQRDFTVLTQRSLANSSPTQTPDVNESVRRATRAYVQSVVRQHAPDRTVCSRRTSKCKARCPKARNRRIGREEAAANHEQGGQITVPHEIRRALGVRPGDKLLFEPDSEN